MNKILISLLFVLWSYVAHGQHVAAFCGGEMYQNIEQNLNTFKLSGFNTAILWSVHVMPNGDFVLNDSKIIANGEYVGKNGWPSAVKNLKEQPTSVNRVEFSIGAWGVPDFENIESLIESEGTSENTILYKNFKKLKEITGADAIDYDDESNYDVGSTVQLSEMLIEIGYKITLCPYTRKSFWQSVYDQVQSNHPGAIDRVYLQCYDGGASNTPAAWNDSFKGLKVTPGLWCSHGADCINGLDWRSVEHKLKGWKSGIEGGFMWSFDGILQCSIGGTPKQYATAIRNVMGIKVSAPGKAYQPHPANEAKEASVDADLSWIGGSFDAMHKVYFGTDLVLTESNLQGTFSNSKFDPGTLKNNLTYYWRVDEVNEAGTAVGDVWSFTTEVVTLPAEKAYEPQPSNNEKNVDIRPALSWTSGTGFINHEIYFGTSNPPLFVKVQTDSIFSPGKLEPNTTYYWRISEANSSGVTEGDIWSFTTHGKNIAPEASLTVSSEYSSDFGKAKAVDGIVKIHGQGEWASKGEIKPWIKLSWAQDRTIDKVILYDRSNGVDDIFKGILTFSDGSAIDVGALPNKGTELVISFPRKTVGWMKFEVTEGSGFNVGLSEIEVIESNTVVGVNQLENSHCFVYPNPSDNGIFHINVPSNDEFKLQIYNSNGVVSKTFNTYKSNEMIDISELPRGIYVLRLRGKSYLFETKVVR
jgi:hypothetical protein